MLSTCFPHGGVANIKPAGYANLSPIQIQGFNTPAFWAYTRIHEGMCLAWDMRKGIQNLEQHVQPYFISGFDYNFTNYGFRKTVDLFEQYIARGVKLKFLIEDQC